MLTDLNLQQAILAHVMSDISEKCYSAGWMMNEEYAIQIARDWNVPASGSGYVTKFALKTAFLNKYDIQHVGGEIHNELWIPAEQLEEFNDNIAGVIEVTREFT